MNIGEIGCVAHKDGGVDVTGDCWVSPVCWHKTGRWTDEFVDADHSPWFGGREDVSAIVGAFEAPGPAMCFTIGTSRIGKWVHICQFPWQYVG